MKGDVENWDKMEELQEGRKYEGRERGKARFLCISARMDKNM